MCHLYLITIADGIGFRNSYRDANVCYLSFSLWPVCCYMHNRLQHGILLSYRYGMSLRGHFPPCWYPSTHTKESKLCCRRLNCAQFQEIYNLSTWSSVLPEKLIPRILCNPKFHYCVHKSHPHVPLPGHINPLHVLPSCFLQIRFSILPSTLMFSIWSFSFRFLHLNPVCIALLPIRAACPTCFILLDLVT